MLKLFLFIEENDSTTFEYFMNGLRATIYRIVKANVNKQYNLTPDSLVALAAFMVDTGGQQSIYFYYHLHHVLRNYAQDPATLQKYKMFMHF